MLLRFLNFSAYQVIVLKVLDGAEKLPDDYDSKLTDANSARGENLNFYITAEIGNDPLHGKSWEFTVGDGTAQGAFVNKALERGEEYVIFQRAMTRDNDVSKLTQFCFFLVHPVEYIIMVIPLFTCQWYLAMLLIGDTNYQDHERR